MLELFNYVMENYIQKIMYVVDGVKYVDREDIERLGLEDSEKRFVLHVVSENGITLNNQHISNDDRSEYVKDLSYGEVSETDYSNRDDSVLATDILDDNGDIQDINFELLDTYVEELLIPKFAEVKKRTIKKNGKRVEVLSIQFNKIMKCAISGNKRKLQELGLFDKLKISKDEKFIKFSEVEIRYMINKLNELGIFVGGINTSLDDQFDNYDCVTTYGSIELPEYDEKINDELLREYKKTKDPALLERIALNNLRLIDSIARKYEWAYGIDAKILYSYGYDGLRKAIELFDFSYNTALSTYAVPWIRSMISKAIPLEKGVKQSVYSDYNFTRKIVKEYGFDPFVVKENEFGRTLFDDEEPEMAITFSDDEISDEAIEFLWARKGRGAKEDNLDLYNAFVKKYRAAMSFETPDVLDGHDIFDIDEIGFDVDQVFDAAVESDLKERVSTALDSLSENQRAVIESRYGFLEDGEKTFAEIGEMLGCCRDTIRILNSKALTKIRTDYRLCDSLRDFHSCR